MSLEVEVIIYNSSKGYPPAFLEKNIQVENGKDLIEKVSAIYEGAAAEGILSKDLENNEYLLAENKDIILETVFYVKENEKQFDLLGGTFRPNGDFSVPYSADSLEFEKERIEERFGNFPFDVNDLNAPAEEELLDILITYYEKGK
tara:strand:+ start:4586 stop:5023 length:438 start_codon:yes stop_codon:yes gene_type:complete